MWIIETEKQRQAREERLKKDIQRLMEEAKRKNKAREDWKKNNPPCPHCGKSDPFPYWFGSF